MNSWRLQIAYTAGKWSQSLFLYLRTDCWAHYGSKSDSNEAQTEEEGRECFMAAATGGHSRLISHPAALFRGRGARVKKQLWNTHLHVWNRDCPPHLWTVCVQRWQHWLHQLWRLGTRWNDETISEKDNSSNIVSKDDKVEFEKHRPPEKCPTFNPHLKLPLPSTQLYCD